jgi:integrase
MKNRLTVAKIRALEPREKLIKISDGHGLALEVRPSGRMAWRWRYRLQGKRHELNLGIYPSVSLAEARTRRDVLLAGVGKGRSPADQRRLETQAQLSGITVKAFGERYMREVVNRVRKNPKSIQRYLDRDIYPTIGSKALVAVQKQELRDLIYARRNAGFEQAALSIRNLLKRLWDYAIELEMTDVNPAALIKPRFIAKVSSRTRVLSEGELKTFLAALDKSHIRNDMKMGLKLILLTLTRKSELRLARWEHINFERGEWEIPAANSKTEAAQIVYLSSQALQILTSLKLSHRSPIYLFPMQGTAHEPMSAGTLNLALSRIPLKIEHFTIHDLRRSAATTLAEQEFNADWIEKALNHKLKGVRGVYNRAQYATQRRTMLQAWADWLDSLEKHDGKQ